MAKESTPDGRAVTIKPRETVFSNYNQKPEKQGDRFFPKCDLSLQFALKGGEVDQLLAVVGGASALWDDEGKPRIAEVSGAIPLSLEAAGAVSIAPMRGKAARFGDAKLKKVSVELRDDNSVQVHCQVRFDPTGSTELLLQLQCVRALKFGFDGHALVMKEPQADVEDESPQRDLEDE